MGAKKGMNNAKAYQHDKVEHNRKKVLEAMGKISPIKEKITDEKELVSLLSKLTGIHRTTFTRKGSKYRKEVLGFLNKQPGATGELDIHDMDMETLRIHTKMQQIHIQELEKENRKLRENSKERIAFNNTEGENDTADTVMTLMLVLERECCMAELDIERQQIIDATKYEDDPDRVIASGARAAPLFALLKENPLIFGTPVKASLP